MEGSAVFLVDPAGRILLQQRDDPVGPAGVGRWAVPGGGREGDEPPVETARREFEEETSARLGRLLPFGQFHGVARPDDSRGLLHAFCSDDVVPREAIEVHEGLDFQYWSPAGLGALPMNPKTRRLVDEFVRSAAYGELTGRPVTTGVIAVEIDRWGRFLVQRRTLGSGDLTAESFVLPAGPLTDAESPDAAAFRVFEAHSGALLETLKLFRTYRRKAPGDRPEALPSAEHDITHVYYHDADLDPALLGDGATFLYIDPAGIALAPLPEHQRTVLTQFVESPAYRAMFH